MRSKPFRRDRDEGKTVLDGIINKMFRQARAQFGSAVKSSWLYDGGLCPGCARNLVGALKRKGEKTLSVNAFIYRERGVLIGYFQCETCASYIFEEAQKNPYHETPLHANIERNLIAAYQEHSATLN